MTTAPAIEWLEADFEEDSSATIVSSARRSTAGCHPSGR